MSICTSYIGDTLYCVLVCLNHYSVLPTTASHELFNGEHKIGKTRLRVEMASHEPTPDQRQNAAYKMGTAHGTTSSVRVVTQQLPPPPPISLPRPDPSPIVCLGSKTGASNIFVAAQSISKNSDRKQTNNTSTAVNSDTGRPSTQLANIHSNSEDDCNPSYITVSGLTNSISTEDLVAYFQTARCGGGTVTEVIYLEQSKDRALVGISGTELNCEFIIFWGVVVSLIHTNIVIIPYALGTQCTLADRSNNVELKHKLEAIVTVLSTHVSF